MDIESIKVVAEMISNLGITIILSSGVVVFIFKLLSMLLKQNQKMVEDIMPRIAELEKIIEKNKSDTMDAITSHNTRAQTMLCNIEHKVESIDEHIKRIDDEQHRFLSDTMDKKDS